MNAKHLILLLPWLLFSCGKEPVEQERPLTPTEGAINARFSVSDTLTVVFAQGNLQYRAATGSWRFATNQYDLIGHGNALIDTTYNGWIDLFGWGTSGHKGLMPYSTSTNNAEYVRGEVNINHTDYDWGQRNAISNAGGQAGLWRTLTVHEWEYLLKYRDKATVKRGLASIYDIDDNGTVVAGLVLLPDKWSLPYSCSFTHGGANGFTTNRYDRAQWRSMQSAGAVFLPAGGYRDSISVSLVGEYGCYWSSSCYTATTAYELYMQPGTYALSTAARSNGHSIRLVQNK